MTMMTMTAMLLLMMMMVMMNSQHKVSGVHLGHDHGHSPRDLHD